MSLLLVIRHGERIGPMAMDEGAVKVHFDLGHLVRHVALVLEMRKAVLGLVSTVGNDAENTCWTIPPGITVVVVIELLVLDVLQMSSQCFTVFIHQILASFALSLLPVADTGVTLCEGQVFSAYNLPQAVVRPPCHVEGCH